MNVERREERKKDLLRVKMILDGKVRYRILTFWRLSLYIKFCTFVKAFFDLVLLNFMTPLLYLLGRSIVSDFKISENRDCT